MCVRPIGSEREMRPFAKTSVESETRSSGLGGTHLGSEWLRRREAARTKCQSVSCAKREETHSICTSTNQVLDDSAEKTSSVVALRSLTKLVDDDERARSGVPESEPVEGSVLAEEDHEKSSTKSAAGQS